MEVHYDLSSDHCPVILDLHTQTTRHQRTAKQTNWKKFKESFFSNQKTISSPEALERAVEDLEVRIQNALDQATTTKLLPTGKNRPLPPNIKQLLARKRTAKKQYLRTLHPADKTIFNRLQEEVKLLLSDLRNAEWAETLEKLPQLTNPCGEWPHL